MSESEVVVFEWVVPPGVRVEMHGDLFHIIGLHRNAPIIHGTVYGGVDKKEKPISAIKVIRRDGKFILRKVLKPKHSNAPRRQD